MKKLTIICLSALIIAVAAVFTVSCKSNEPSEQPYAEYPLYVADVQVTTENASDIKGEGIHGKVSYNHKTKTLTLDKAAIVHSGEGIVSKTDNLVIRLVGASTVNTVEETLVLDKSASITGNADTKLTLKSSFADGIYCKGSLTVSGGCTVSVEAGDDREGVFEDSADGKLIVDKSTFKAIGADGSVVGFEQITLTGCKITAPAGAVFDASLKGVALNGSLVKNTWVVITP